MEIYYEIKKNKNLVINILKNYTWKKSNEKLKKNWHVVIKNWRKNNKTNKPIFIVIFQ
jgi:hypothetical protein